jgi:hypothetical protein
MDKTLTVPDPAECEYCRGTGEVQCVNLGDDNHGDDLPCPGCIAAEIAAERSNQAGELTRLAAENERLLKERDELIGVVADRTLEAAHHAAENERLRGYQGELIAAFRVNMIRHCEYYSDAEFDRIIAALEKAS